MSRSNSASAADGHSLREHLEATNHAAAYDELRRLVERAAPITLETILHLHALVLHDIHDTAGQFRQTSVFIRGSNHRPPPARQVPALMAQWVRYTEQAQAEPRGRSPRRRHVPGL